MKTIRNIILPVFILLLFGCKDPKTEGIINVVNLSDNQPIPGSAVKLYMEDADNIFFPCNKSEGSSEENFETGPSGTTEKICFSLPTIINVKVTTPDSRVAYGKLALVDGETITATIKVN